MGLYQRLLGHPFVYNHVRPLVVGVDLTPFYRRAAAGKDAVILDVGCGTGDALRYLTSFERYVGLDVDGVAIDYARKTYAGAERVSFLQRSALPSDFAEHAPTHVLLGGLLHHLDDDSARSLLTMIARSPHLVRIVTNDIVFLPREPINNLLARLDRGRFCRQEQQYRNLVEQCGLVVTESAIVRSHPTRGLAKYLVMTIEPRA